MSKISKAQKRMNNKSTGLEGDPVIAATLGSIARSLKKIVKSLKGA